MQPDGNVTTTMNIPSILRHWFTLAATAITAWIFATLVLSADDQAALAKAIGDLVGPMVIIGTLVVTALWRMALAWLGKTFRTGSGETEGNTGGGSGGNLSAVVCWLGIGTAAVGFLPSCSLPMPSGAEYPVRGYASYTDPETGATVGLSVGSPQAASAKAKKAKAVKVRKPAEVDSQSGK